MPVQNHEPGQVPPQVVGLSQARLNRIRPYMEGLVASNRIAGGAGLIARHGKIAYLETWGMADKDTGVAMREDSIYRIYSMTKAVTGVAAMLLYEEGYFGLLDPLSNYLPEFANMRVAVEKDGKLTGTVPADRPITVLDVMRHTAGFNYVGPHDEDGTLTYQRLGLQMGYGSILLSEMTQLLSQAPLVSHPGTLWDYGFGTDVLGRLVEVVSGQPLDEFFAERILEPLDMLDTGFHVPEEKWERLVTFYQPNADGTVSRTNFVGQESFKKKPRLLMGGAGLTSTIRDYARFAQMLLNGGELHGERLLSPKTVELMSADHLGTIPISGGLLPQGHGFGLTFAVSRGPGKTATLPSAGQFRWGGYAGTSFWIDPRENMIGVFMIQTMGDLAKRTVFQQLAYQAIVE